MRPGNLAKLASPKKPGYSEVWAGSVNSLPRGEKLRENAKQTFGRSKRPLPGLSTQFQEPGRSLQTPEQVLEFPKSRLHAT
jgi:hypothetical protein